MRNSNEIIRVGLVVWLPARTLMTCWPCVLAWAGAQYKSRCLCTFMKSPAEIFVPLTVYTIPFNYDKIITEL